MTDNVGKETLCEKEDPKLFDIHIPDESVKVSIDFVPIVTYWLFADTAAVFIVTFGNPSDVIKLSLNDNPKLLEKYR